jgi:hypothetical protein
LALELYYREHATLPASLDQLVPTYLPAVLLDYFDRRPIRYSIDYFAVWSVGDQHANVTSVNPTLRDKDIDHDTRPNLAPEIYVRLDFAAPPRPEQPEAVSASKP